MKSFILKLFRGKKTTEWIDDQFSKYQKTDLDFEVDLRNNSAIQGDYRPDDYIKVGTAGAPPMQIDTLANCTDGSYPNNLIRMAQILRDMKVQYSIHASEFAKLVFSAQDELGLDENDLEKSIKQIIKQRQVVNETAFEALQVVAKNYRTARP